jgi:hypothetical protein
LAGCAGLPSLYYFFIEEHTNDDTRPKAKSAATHGWAGTFIDNLLKTHVHRELSNTSKITISSNARYLSHLNAYRSGVLSSTTIGPSKWEHPLHYYYKLSKPLRSTSRLLFQQIHTHISFPAQRPAVEPLGRLCRTSSLYIIRHRRTHHHYHQAEGQVGSNRGLGAIVFLALHLQIELMISNCYQFFSKIHCYFHTIRHIAHCFIEFSGCSVSI